MHLKARLYRLQPAHQATPVPESRRSQSCLLWVSLLALLSALLCWALFGYHAGFIALNRSGSVLPDACWESLTLLGDARLALALLLFVIYRHPYLLPAALLAILPSLLIIQGFKRGMPVERPASVLAPEQYHAIGELLHLGSFPSGHAATVAILAALLLLISSSDRQRALILSLLGLAAVSRVMIGAHWPVDVLVGTAVGLLSGWFGYVIAGRYRLGRHPLSQWCSVALLAVAALSTFGSDGGYPEGHATAMLLAGLALARYLNQLYGRTLPAMLPRQVAGS